MVAVAKSGTPSPATALPGNEHVIAGYLAGEALGAFDACRLGSDKKIYRSSGAAATVNANVHGYTAQAYNAGEPVTLYDHIQSHYGAGMTPGTSLFLSGTTPGGLDTAASTGGTVPIAFVQEETVVKMWAWIGR
jgi:hypothetical protein